MERKQGDKFMEIIEVAIVYRGKGIMDEKKKFKKVKKTRQLTGKLRSKCRPLKFIGRSHNVVHAKDVGK